MTVETSPELAQLAEALAKAQGAIKNAAATSSNPMYASSYASLAEVWSACRVPLTINGLSVVQMPTQVLPEGRVGVTTMLLHSSGQWIRSSLAIHPERDDPQAVGSAITYARRYALAAVVGVAQGWDDDGNATRGPVPRANTVKADGTRASYDQLALLEALRERAGVVVCGDLMGECPWKTKKHSKRARGLVDAEVRCAFHADLAAFKMEDGSPVTAATYLSPEQCETLCERYRRKAESKDRRAAQGIDLAPIIGRLCDCNVPAADVCRNKRGQGAGLECTCLCHREDNIESAYGIKLHGPVDGHATMPKAEHDLSTVLRALSQSDMTEQELAAHFGKDTVAELTYGDIPDALALIGDYGTERYELTVEKLREKQGAAT